MRGADGKTNGLTALYPYRFYPFDPLNPFLHIPRRGTVFVAEQRSALPLTLFLLGEILELSEDILQFAFQKFDSLLEGEDDLIHFLLGFL